MSRHPKLQPHEIDALRRYRDKHGRGWKSTLSDAWMGLYPFDDQGTLRTLRNTHGPSWLVNFRFPPESST